MRTLIISDLHLGNRARLDVLRLPAPRARLLDALHSIDRLVLLGDTLELMTRQPRRAMAIAEPVLRDIGERMGPDREVLVVPGNHDAPLVRSWALEQGSALGLAHSVDPAATRALARVTKCLAPARVTVHYPGVWLRDGVWATHGHYLDKHLLPESSFGLPRGRLLSTNGVVRVSPIEYERAGRRGRRRTRDSVLSRLAARPVATVLELSAEVARSATMPRVPVMLMNANMTPVTATLIDAQMRRASLPAMVHVTRRLGVEAEWVIFGHVHRLGPMNGERWPGGDGAARFVNTGSWLYEPLLLKHARPPHPYWPGGAVLLESGQPPQTLGLLDDLEPEQLRRSGGRIARAVATSG